MKPHFALLPVIIAVASIGAVITTQDHAVPRVEPHDTPPSIEHHHEWVNEHFALAEMTIHAARHLDATTLHEETLSSDEAWTPTWHLQWVDAESLGDGSSIRIFHATNTVHPEVRFTATCDANGNCSSWQPVR